MQKLDRDEAKPLGDLAQAAGPLALAAAEPLKKDARMVLQGLNTQAWKTMSARFLAHKRLNNKNLWSTWTVAALSIYLITASLILGSSSVGLTPGEKEIGSYIAVTLSVLVLVLSLTEASRNYVLRSERLHLCGIELDDLCRRIDVALLDSNEGIQTKLSGFTEEYAEMIRRCPENHEDIDFLWFKAQRPEVGKYAPYKATFLRSWYWIRSYGLYLATIVSPALLLIWLLVTR